MASDNSHEKDTNKPRGRLDYPGLRIASVFVAIIAICALLYSLASSLPIIPVMTAIFFLLLWFVPAIWRWIEWVFSKRPSSRWGRFVLNLVLAIIMASAFEDVLEIIQRFARIIFWIVRRNL